MQPRSTSSTSLSQSSPHLAASPSLLAHPLPRPPRHVNHLPLPSYPRLEQSRSILPFRLPTRSLLSRTGRSTQTMLHHHNVHLINRVLIPSLPHLNRRPNHMSPVARLLRTPFHSSNPPFWYSVLHCPPQPILQSQEHVNVSEESRSHLLQSRRSAPASPPKPPSPLPVVPLSLIARMHRTEMTSLRSSMTPLLLTRP